jgi:cellobiose phosphorylase
VERKFRDAIYAINVKNPSHVCKGVASITVNGEQIKGNVIPFVNAGQTAVVEVVLG